MPVVFRHQNVRFHFFSNEGAPREPVHVHAESSDGEAKFWFNRRQLSELAELVHHHREEIERAWNEHFG